MIPMCQAKKYLSQLTLMCSLEKMYGHLHFRNKEIMTQNYCAAKIQTKSIWVQSPSSFYHTRCLREIHWRYIGGAA